MIHDAMKKELSVERASETIGPYAMWRHIARPRANCFCECHGVSTAPTTDYHAFSHPLMKEWISYRQCEIASAHHPDNIMQPLPQKPHLGR